MRVGVNLLKLSQDRFGGVEQYVKHLLDHLIKVDEQITLFLFLTKPHRDLFPDFLPRVKKVMIKASMIPSSLLQNIDHYQLDLWFSPLHKSYISSINLPTVVTIHDVLHTSYPQFVEGELKENNDYYRRFAASFDRVLTVSEFSKKAISKHLLIPENKIHSIHLDAPSNFRLLFNEDYRLNVKKKYSLDEEYMIYPASFNPHKNHLNLLTAIALLRDHYNKKIQLVLTGYASKDNQAYQSVLQFIKKFQLGHQVRILGYVPKEDMPYLYASSSFMVFPSLFEGFGIPIVEAMKTGCPIVCSDRGSIPEVAGDAALFFNPEDPKDIASKILKMMDVKVRRNLIDKGKIQAECFSWNRTAVETLQVLREVARRRMR
jgi:alpha-1,3-rhamnosyl/mannosyltransferase